MSSLVIDAIKALGEVTSGGDDRQSHTTIKQTIKAIETRNSKWPSIILCKIVFKMEDDERQLFLDVLKDMDYALTEAFKLAEQGV